MPLRALGLVLIAALSLSACSSLRQTLGNKPCRLDTDQPFDVVTIDLEQHAIKLLWKDAAGKPLRTLANAYAGLHAEGDSVIALTNGGIYTRSLASLGLYIQRSEELVRLNEADGYGNFYLKPNGVFLITGDEAQIVSTDEYRAGSFAPDYALQSGPLLVHDGTIHPALTPGSANCRLRSGLGVNAEGRVHLAISNGYVNFYDFATLFREALGADDALYLDGAISELYAPGLGRDQWTRQRFATFLAVVAKD